MRERIFFGNAALALAALIAAFAPPAVCADVIRYVDDGGKTHYVSAPEKVPQKYQDQLANQKPLPGITRLPAREFDAQIKGLKNGEQTSKREPAAAQGSKVEVYVTDWCQYCQKVEAFLKAKNVRYTRLNVEKDKKSAQMHRQLGGGGVPVIKIGTRVIRGFNPDQISSALKLN